MILLKSLKLNNFISHSETTIEFKERTHQILIGRSGSGKSGILEAITWCLYNKGRIDNRNIIQKGKKITKVILELIEDDTIYRIDRSVNDKGKNTLDIYIKKGDKDFKVIDITGLKEKQIYLEKEILHCSYTLLINSIISPQINNESFISQTAVERKNLLLQIASIDNLDDYLTKTKALLSELQQDKSNNEGVITTINQTLEEDKKEATNLPILEKQEIDRKKELETINTSLKTLSKQLIELNFKAKSKEEKNSELGFIKNTTIPFALNEINKNQEEIKKLDELDIPKMQSEIANIDQLKIELNGLKAVETVCNEWNTKMVKTMGEQPITRDFNKEIEEINRQLIILMKQPEEKCPQCGFKLPNEYKDNTSKHLQEELVHKNKDKDEYDKSLLAYEEKIKVLGEKPIFDNTKIKILEDSIYTNEQKKISLDTLIRDKDFRKITYQEKVTAKLEEIKEKENKITILEDEIKILIQEITSKTELEDKENNLISKKRILETELNSITGDLSLAKNAKSRVISSEEQLKKINATTKELNVKIGALTKLKMALGTNGIKAMVVDIIVPELEDRINYILAKLSDFRIKIETQKSSADGDSVIEGLYLIIRNDVGEEMDFSSYSGGEKMRISMAISEGLASLQKFAFRIIDENIVGLDAITIENFTDVMLKLKEDIQQLIIVSHIPQIADIFEDKIEVRKINGNSEIIN